MFKLTRAFAASTFTFLHSPGLVAKALEFDGVGNMLTDGQKSLVYNSQNRLIEADSPLGTGQYLYKDSGSRLRKRFSLTSNPGQTTELLNPTRLMTQQAKHGAQRGLVNHIYVNGVRLAALGPDATGQPAIRYYHTDQVSSVKLVTDGTADVVQRHEYRPYGGELSPPRLSAPLPARGEGPGGGDSPKFNSQEHDKESGLDFFNARHYDSKLAHFTSADTVIDGEGSSAGWNRYMYVQGNPVRYADPSGHGLVFVGTVAGEEGTIDTFLFRNSNAMEYLLQEYGGMSLKKLVQDKYISDFLEQIYSADRTIEILVGDNGSSKRKVMTFDRKIQSLPPWAETLRATNEARRSITIIMDPQKYDEHGSNEAGSDEHGREAGSKGELIASLFYELQNAFDIIGTGGESLPLAQELTRPVNTLSRYRAAATHCGMMDFSGSAHPLLLTVRDPGFRGKAFRGIRKEKKSIDDLEEFKDKLFTEMMTSIEYMNTGYPIKENPADIALARAEYEKKIRNYQLHKPDLPWRSLSSED